MFILQAEGENGMRRVAIHSLQRQQRHLSDEVEDGQRGDSQTSCLPALSVLTQATELPHQPAVQRDGAARPRAGFLRLTSLEKEPETETGSGFPT